MFITFEGPEGGGKSTQIKILSERLESAGKKVLTTRQPGGDELGQKLRSIMLDSSTLKIDPMAELLMMMADRAQSVEHVIKPALKNGIVICDRYIDSSIAYQGYGRGIDLETVSNLNLIATTGLLPDITFLLDIEPSIGLRRQTNLTRMEGEALEFHNRVREGYLATAERNSDRFKIIDASGTIDEVAAAIWRHYETHCGNRA